MRNGSLFWYYVVFIFALVLCIYSDQKYKSIQRSWKNLNVTTQKFSQGQTTTPHIHYTSPVVYSGPPPAPWRDFVLTGVPDSPVDYTTEPQILMAIIREEIAENNENIEIQNEQLISDGKWNGITIAIQVHNRLDLLRELFGSVKLSSESENSLLIISMDTKESDIIKEISLFDHCALIVIYHPFSMQFYRDQYPATDTRDCSRDQKTNLENCNREAKTDTYGHFREAKFSQIKLHWTWKLNFIFTRIKDYEIDNLILLEEDHYLTTDALHVAKEIIVPNIKECENSNKICLGALGTYVKPTQKFPSTDSLQKTLWISGSHNMGMIVTRKWFEEVKRNAFSYCFHDDYNWDFSLMKISKDQNWQVFLPALPRVFHLGGECGYHAKKHNCNISGVKSTYAGMVDRWKHLLFPKTMRVANLNKKFPTNFKAYGGWGDIRDRRLCLLDFDDLDGPLANL